MNDNNNLNSRKRSLEPMEVEEDPLRHVVAAGLRALMPRPGPSSIRVDRMCVETAKTFAAITAVLADDTEPESSSMLVLDNHLNHFIEMHKPSEPYVNLLVNVVELTELLVTYKSDLKVFNEYRRTMNRSPSSLARIALFRAMREHLIRLRLDVMVYADDAMALQSFIDEDYDESIPSGLPAAAGRAPPAAGAVGAAEATEEAEEAE